MAGGVWPRPCARQYDRGVLRRLRIDNLALIRSADLELDGGLVAVTGETGAGKTIFTQAIGLLLGARGDGSYVGADAREAYVEAEFDVPEGFFSDPELAALAEVRPEDEPGVVLARRVFADGRTRAYAWGRSVTREALALAAERLVAMSGQFEQRRLARPSFQLDQLDAFVGAEHLEARSQLASLWNDLAGARRAVTALEADEGAARLRIESLRQLVADTDGLTSGEEAALREERERARHGTEIAAGIARALEALAPDEGEGASALAVAAERALAPLEQFEPALGACAAELREASIRLDEAAHTLHVLAAGLEFDPARVEAVEARLDELATVRRRYAAASLDDLLLRRAEAEAELDRLGADGDPLAAARGELARLEADVAARAAALAKARRDAAPQLANAVSSHLENIGMGQGEFVVELTDRELGPTGRDVVSFLIRPNPGLPFGPVAETASGGELSRVALALAAVAGGETLVFDEIDAGIGGVTAHKVAELLQRLAGDAQVITITHLPQIASVAQQHLRVEKVPGDPTHTRIDALSPDERRAELERMLGGVEFVSTFASNQA